MDAVVATRLEAALADGRRAVDDALARAVPAKDARPPALHEAMRYTLLLPGKRLRAILVLLACDLVRGRRSLAMPAACAVEMVHASSLILDDLPSQDDATLRRGRPTLHRVAGEANATLAAVALLNHAFATLGRSSLRERARLESIDLLATSIGSDGLIGGQVVDLASTGRKIGLENLEYIHAHKTGALFIAAAELGVVAGGGRVKDREALASYAKNVGLAFQITDDVLDVVGDPSTTGKDAGLDRDHTTFASLCGVDGAHKLVDELIESSIGHLEPFGPRADLLRALAEFVRMRDR